MNKNNKYGYINKETFKKGGPVKMAIGGDPLTNLNQQQFSPDPAFEGQDFFQEAVDSGNLQAVNLLNLFKVFKKPKVMATPSNVKQVEQARDPMPHRQGHKNYNLYLQVNLTSFSNRFYLIN